MSDDGLKDTAEIEDRMWQAAEQLALHLGVVKDSVYRWRGYMGLPAHKIGRLWKFRFSEVEDWVRTGGADDESEEAGTAK